MRSKLSNTIYTVVNKTTGNLWSTPNGKWIWHVPHAASNAYTYHARRFTYGERVGPKLGDGDCQYRLEAVSTGRERATQEEIERFRSDLTAKLILSGELYAE